MAREPAVAEERTTPPARVPTLTEVVGEVPPVDEARIVNQVLGDLQQRIDLMFEYRVRETLAPVLARLSETMLREARDELARTLRDVVSRAVSQELSKRRPR
jgi:hypothetical protein